MENSISGRRYALMSFDVELVPPSIFSSANATVSYDRVMSRLGTKSHPHVSQQAGCNMHIDGISAEFAPSQPLSTPTQVMDTFRAGRSRLEMFLNDALVGKDWVDLAHVQGFDEADTPFLWEETQAFGCSPDYMYGKARQVPRTVKDRTIRELGLHWHLDLRDEYRDQRTPVQKAQGKPPTNAVMVAKVAAELAQRTAFLFTARHPRLRLWYRQPALYRPTPYGIEYRSFGSEICNDEDRMYTLTNIMHNFMKDHFAGTGTHVPKERGI